MHKETRHDIQITHLRPCYVRHPLAAVGAFSTLQAEQTTGQPATQAPHKSVRSHSSKPTRA